MGNQQTKAALDVLFADNTTRDISPARLRDFLESCLPSSGGLHFDDPGTVTPIATVSTWTKAANTSTAHDLNRFDAPVANRLRYTGTVPARAQVTATLSFACALNNQQLAFGIAVNGAIVTSSKITTKISTAGDVQAVTVMTHPTLAPNDYVEVFVMNETSDADITIAHGHVHAVAFLT